MLFIDTTTIAVIFILGLSTFVRSAIGFGDALIAMGLLTSLVGLKIATPLVALVGTPISLSILISQWRNVKIKAVLPLIISTLIGIPFGLILIKFVPEQFARATLGVILITYGIYNLIGLKLPEMKNDRFASLFGFFAGILGGAYTMNGLVVVIYGHLRRWEPQQFRLMLQGYFFCTNFLILAGHAFSGLWTIRVWSLMLMSLPFVGISVWLGSMANRRINREFFTKFLFTFLLITGLLSLYQSIT
ncbi:MAG: sulfite exporter TauE/SafE family protein [Rivularia sp. ALOHA_DT_140]|nr:sulfite exporter TauE/SafE family protein [Rivularia sp. ALOHA_DT_140]